MSTPELHKMQKQVQQARVYHRAAHQIAHYQHVYGDTATTWHKANAYLINQGLSTYFLSAIGIDDAQAAKQWFTDYYVADENDGPQTKARIQRELQDMDPAQIYESNQGLDKYNRGTFTPDSVQVASPDEIQEALSQTLSDLTSKAELGDGAQAYFEQHKEGGQNA